LDQDSKAKTPAFQYQQPTESVVKEKKQTTESYLNNKKCWLLTQQTVKAQERKTWQINKPTIECCLCSDANYECL